MARGHERQPDQRLPDVEGGLSGDERDGGGKIVNIGSMTSIFGAGFAPAYAASKGGIVQLTKSLALAWAPDNIQVNAILPGWFDTELTEKAREQIPGLHERVLARIAAGPMGQAGRHGGHRHLARQPGQRLRHRHRRARSTAATPRRCRQAR